MERVTFYWVHDARSFIDILLSVASTTRPNRFRSVIIFNSMFTNVFKSALVRDPSFQQHSNRAIRAFKSKNIQFICADDNGGASRAHGLPRRNRLGSHYPQKCFYFSIFNWMLRKVGHLLSSAKTVGNSMESNIQNRSIGHSHIFFSIELNCTFLKEKNEKKI